MERIIKFSQLFFYTTFNIVLLSFSLSCSDDTPSENFNEKAEDQEQPEDTRTKWAPFDKSDCPEELWDWCITRGYLSHFPSSEKYDFTDFSHTDTYLMIFDYWKYNYTEFSYTKLLQKERLHIFSNGSTNYALSKLSKKIFIVRNIGDNLKDYDNEIFFTESGIYDCNKFIAMDNKNIFNLVSFDFETMPDYFWMFLHEKDSPDNTEAIWAETDSVSILYDISLHNDLPFVNVNTYFTDKLVTTNASCSWCWIHSDESSATLTINSTPYTYTHKVTLKAYENNSTSPRAGIIYLTAENHPEQSIAIHVTQAGKPDSGSGGVNDDWVKVRASGYLPYWYCPTTGKTTPSTLKTDNDVTAYKNTITKAYKIRWAYKEYPAHKGYNKIIMDKMYHSVYDSQFNFWKQCCDYFYYEVTIYD